MGTDDGGEETPDQETGEITHIDVGELKVVQDAPKRRVSLSLAERGVEAEGPDDLAELVTAAERLWQLTRADGAITFGFRAGGTLYTELADGRAGQDREAEDRQ